MIRIGCHLSSSKGFMHMGQEAVSIGANTFQFFTRNPRGGTAKPLDEADAAAYRAFAAERGIGPVIAHAPYTLNACAAEEGLRTFARDTMRDDLRRLAHLPGNFYNFHPGSHVKQGTEVGIALIAETLNAVLPDAGETTVLLETMAGKGSEVGGRFEELRAIIDRVEHAERLGVCLDTCHVFDAGYDIVNDLDGVLAEFDRVIGLGRLRAVHLNDSMNALGSHKDRHACLGEGQIGLPALLGVVQHPALAGLPIALETPNDLPGYAREIALVREACGA
ncbi:MAG: deoxyribonuclease IV [Christensenellales bacterium]